MKALYFQEAKSTCSATAKNNMRSNHKNAILKVLILGDPGVGKSCLLSRFVINQFYTHGVQTIGIEFLNKKIDIDEETYTLQIWDTGGQERFRTLRTPFYRGTDICMLTYAIDDRSSFNNLQMWQQEFLYYADIKENAQFPFIVIGNKCDVMSDQREISKLEMETWCNENSITSCIETSAKNASNVQEAFKMAVRRWLSLEIRADRDERGNEALMNDSVKLTKRQSEKRTGTSCCIGTSYN